MLGSVVLTTTGNSGIKTSGSHQTPAPSPFVDDLPLHGLKTIVQDIAHLNTRPVFQAGSKEQRRAQTSQDGMIGLSGSAASLSRPTLKKKKVCVTAEITYSTVRTLS